MAGYVTLVFLVLVVILLVVLLVRRPPEPDLSEIEAQLLALGRAVDLVQTALREEMARSRAEGAEAARASREEAAAAAAALRSELAASLKNFSEAMGTSLAGVGQNLNQQLDVFAKRLAELSGATEARLTEIRTTLDNRISALQTENNTRLDRVRETVEGKLRELQTDNAQKLEQMRATVEEKLQGTLEARLGESFRSVSERLEQVHKGLGEMQQLAEGVGDLKKVMTNVKTRGTWGEIQLATLLEQMLSPAQYDKNVATGASSSHIVEFAIRLPGRSDDGGEPVWLPIDSKFPVEDYQRILDAADPATLEAAGKQLEQRIRLSAKDIHDKYLNPPKTTDFGILFLPTEGLYAEVIRRTALTEALQRDYRIVVAGPTTLTALLSSLQMGFRTLAVEKRSSEVWKVLGAVKTEFVKFGDLLDNLKKKLDQAGNEIDKAGVRTRAIERKLRSVEALPETESQDLLALEDGVVTVSTSDEAPEG